MLRPLVIGPQEKAKIAEVIAYAEAHRIDLARLRRIVAKEAPFAGQIPGHRLLIPIGYGVTFTIEEHPPPIGWCRHISVGLHSDPPALGKGPHQISVQAIMTEFGMQGAKEDCHMYLEGEGTEVLSVNVIEKIRDT
jgi:hypothetical protein